MSIDDIYELDEQFFSEFDYQSLVQSQESQDVRGVNVSQVLSLLSSHEDGKEIVNDLIHQYKETLVNAR